MVLKNVTKLPKFQIPRVTESFRRDRIQQFLSQPHKNIIWTVAPAGTGKTTAIASYLNELDKTALWYRIDDADSDVSSFYYYFGLSLKNLNIDIDDSMPLFTPEYHSNLLIFSRNYFRHLFSLFENGTTFVFDNFQEASNKDGFYNIIRIALEEVPDNITIYVISRNSPPTEFARLQTSNKFLIVDYDLLKLTKFEQREFSDFLGLGSFNDDEHEKIYQLTRGWILGLILCNKQSNNIKNIENEIGRDNQKIIFKYMATELFNELNKDVQNILLKTAFLTNFSYSMAENITKDRNTKETIDNLIENHFFITSTHQDTGYFEYHPLLTEFLINQAEKIFDSNTLVSLKYDSAKTLTEAKEYEQAVKLYIEIKDWESMINILIDNAQIFINQGRHTMLGNYIQKIPEHILQKNPWLMYWLAVTQLGFNPSQARHLFIEAYDQFKINNDVSGLYLSWAGIIDTFIYEWNGFVELDDWIIQAEYLQNTYPEFPSIEIRARFSFGKFAALMYRQPYSPECSSLAEEVSLIIQHNSNPTIRMMMGHILVMYYYWWNGDMNKAGALVSSLRPHSADKKLPALTQIVWYAIEANYNWLTASIDSCAKADVATNSGLLLAKTSGIHLWDFMLYAQGIWTALTKSDIQLAEQYLSKMVTAQNHDLLMNVCLYHDTTAIVALHNKNYLLALEHGKTALEYASKTGMYFSSAMTHVTCSMVYMELGEYDNAVSYLLKTDKIGSEMNSHFITFLCLFIKVALELNQKDNHAAIKLLKKGFLLSKQYKLENHIWFKLDKWTEFCVLALKHDIEVEHVQNLIRNRNLLPKDAPHTINNWPWYIKIFTFGRFGLSVNNIHIDVKNKSINKPIEMLKVILSLGGRDVPEGKVSDILWPEAEGDLAKQNFKMTLHRLRKLLQVSNVLLLHNRKLTLNDRICWVDSWVMFRTFSKIDKQKSINLEETTEQLQNLIDYYTGKYLSSDVDFWVLMMREKLHTQYLKSILTVSGLLERSMCTDEAIIGFNKLIEFDPVSEKGYQGLIRCYCTQGRQADAVTTYKNCAEKLKQVLGVKPSTETQLLHSKMTDNILI